MALTKQEILNRVWDHAVVQKKQRCATPSELPGKDRCLYRGPDGNKCWAGIFIPDQMYTSEMEKCGIIGAVVAIYPKLLELWGITQFSNEFYFMCMLQATHDRALAGSIDFTSEAESALRNITVNYSLVIPTQG